MNRIFKTLFSLVSVFVTAAAFAQQVPQAEPAISCDKFKIDWTANASLYTLDSGSTFVLNDTLSTKIFDKVTVGVGLDVISNENPATGQQLAWQLNQGASEGSGTGLSDVDLFVKYNAFKGKCDYLKADVWADVNAGVYIPVDGEYSSSAVTAHAGADVGVQKDKFEVVQGFNYVFTGDYTFNPVFGGYVTDDVLRFTTTVTYNVAEMIKFGVKADQQYSGSYNAFLLGPIVNFKLTERASLSAEVGFAVSQDIPYDNVSSVVGLGFKYAF